MDRSEFVKKVVELARENGIYFRLALSAMHSGAEHLIRMALFTGRTLLAEKMAINSIIAEAINELLKEYGNLSKLEDRLAWLEVLAGARIDYDEVYGTILDELEKAKARHPDLKKYMGG